MNPQMRILSILMQPLKYQDHASVFKKRGRRGPGLKGRWRIGCERAAMHVQMDLAVKPGGDFVYERGGDARRKF